MGRSKEAEEQYHQEMEEYQDYDNHMPWKPRDLEESEWNIALFIVMECNLDWRKAKELIIDDTWH